MFTKLPKGEYGVAVIANDIQASDVSFVGGVLSIKDDSANTALSLKTSDILSSSKTAYSAGVLSIKTIDFSLITLTDNGSYLVVIELPYRQSFFGGGVETNALIKSRSYVGRVGASPTVQQVRDAILESIQNDAESGIVAAAVSTDSISITMTDVNSGDTVLTVPSGATITVGTPYTAPSGSPTEAKLYIPVASVDDAGTYTKYIINYRKDIKMNVLSGQNAVKHESAIIFIEETATDFAASVALIDGAINKSLLGTAGTNCSVVEYGDGRDITTVINLDSVVLGAPTAGGNSAHGALIYTFPAGSHVHTATYMSVGLTTGGVTTDTPDVGVGSVIGTGAVAVLGGTATFEDYITGQTAANSAGTATVKTSVATAGALTGISINEAASAKTVHLNAADGWNASVTGNLVANGKVVLKWTKMS
jgi:hypothetical protein